ncbi:MAG: glycosyltransferase family 9 protein [Deltaproteobacteria bacterium]
MKILIVKLSSIGDVVHTLPSLFALRKSFEAHDARSRIDWLVEEGASGILKDNPMIDNLIVVKRRGWLKDLSGNIKALKRIRSVGYDIVLDFQGLLKSGVWVWLSAGKRKIGFSNAREGSSVFLNEKPTAYNPEMHAVDRYLELAGHAAGGAFKGGAIFPLGISDKERSQALQKLGTGSGDKGFFLVISRARWPTKLWDDEKFAMLAKAVYKECGLVPVLVGGAADRASLDGINAMAGGMALNLAGRLGLKDLAAIAGLARFTVSVDSGPMHIAAAAGSRVVAIFGPTAPRRTGPYGTGHVVVRKEMECSPCFKKSCSHVSCMAGVGVEEVFDAILGILKANKGKAGSTERIFY